MFFDVITITKYLHVLGPSTTSSKDGVYKQWQHIIRSESPSRGTFLMTELQFSMASWAKSILLRRHVNTLNRLLFTVYSLLKYVYSNFSLPVFFKINALVFYYLLVRNVKFILKL